MSGPAFEDDGLSSEDEEDEEDGTYGDAEEMLAGNGPSATGITAPSNNPNPIPNSNPNIQGGAFELEGLTPQFEFSELKLSPLIISADLPPVSPLGVGVVSAPPLTSSTSASSTATARPSGSGSGSGSGAGSAPSPTSITGASVTVQEPTPIDTTPNVVLPPSPITENTKEKEKKKSSFSALAKGIRRPTFTPRSSSLGLSLGGGSTSISSSGHSGSNANVNANANSSSSSVPPHHPYLTTTPSSASAPLPTSPSSFSPLTPTGGLSSSEPTSGTTTPALKSASLPLPPTSPSIGKKRRPKFKRSKASEYNFASNNDILGIVMLEIVGAENLPRLKNSAFDFPLVRYLVK